MVSFFPNNHFFSIREKFYIAQISFTIRQGLNYLDTCTVRIRGNIIAIQQERGNSNIELWDYSSRKLLSSIEDPFVIRQTNFAFTKSNLILHTDYGALSIYNCEV